MKILSPSICFVVCFIVLYQGSNALFRAEPLFRQNPKDRYYLDEQVNIHLKDTKPKLSPNVRAILINLATFTIRKIHAYNFSNFTDNSNQTLHSMRAISKEFGLSTKAVGGLAVLSLVGYGALSSFAPEMKNEISNSLSKEEKEGMHKLVTSCLAGMSDGLMRWVEDSVNELPSFPRLNAQECMKRSICEAHNKPRKYGLVGLALQLFFPPYIESKNEARVTSKYQLAAQHGRDNPNCSHYDDCLLSFMDLTRTLTNFLFQMSR